LFSKKGFDAFSFGKVGYSKPSIIKRNTSHGVIVENPKNNKSTNVPTHQDILAVWIYPKNKGRPTL